MRLKSIKLLTAAVIGLNVIAGGVPAAITTAAGLAGDANGDGKFTIADAVTLQNYLLARTKTISPDADIDRSGRIDVYDLVQMRKLLFDGSVNIDYSALKINEVCSSNKNGIVDSYGEHSDWIELYNNSGADINLYGLGLSDGKKNAFKYTFPDVTIKAYDYLLVYATKDYVSTDTELHAPFNISKDGETIYLTHPTQGTVDVIEVPALEADTTYGRYTDGTDNYAVLKPTPAQSNELEASKLNGPVFSVESGFYGSEFRLDITAADGCTIYYTTDGTIPDASSERYTGSISVRDRSNEENVISANNTVTYPDGGNLYIPRDRVAKSTVIKAVAIDSEGNRSSVVTKTYFVGIDQASRYNGLPVVSISIDPDDLFNYNDGIYTTGYYYDEFRKNNHNVRPDEDWKKEANFTQKGREWEKPVHVDFFEGDGSLGFAEDLGMRIQGAASRANTQKSLKFFARSEYGAGSVKYELIPDAKTSSGKVNGKYDKFILRNGANDINSVKFRDPMIQELVSDRDFETQEGRPVIAFINGEYWGVYQLQEDYSSDYINEIYGYDKNEVVIIKSGSEVEEGVESDMDDYKRLLDYVRSHDMSSDSNYREFCSMADIQSMADFYAVEIYINNQDVFSGEWVNNYRMWKTRSVIDDKEGDGRWRWMLYDTEYSSDVYGPPMNMWGGEGNLDALKGALSEKADTVVFAKIYRENEEFRQLFLNTVMDIMNENFRTDKVNSAIEKYRSLYQPVIDENVRRFGPEWRLEFFDYSSELQTLRSFFSSRKNTFIQGLQKYYEGAGRTSDLTVSINGGGTVRINTITPEMTGNGSWTGTYFADIPVTLTAVPDEGRTFAGWSGDVKSSDPVITVTLSQAMNIRAEFAG